MKIPACFKEAKIWRNPSTLILPALLALLRLLAAGGGNGDNAGIDRDMTPLASNQKINYGALAAIVGLGLLFVLWQVGAFSTEERD